MNSSTLSLTGIILALIGVTISTINNAMASPDLYMSYAGAGLTSLGLLCFIPGILWTFVIILVGGDNNKNKLHRDEGNIAAMAIIRSMIAVSIADNKLDDRETETILKTYEQLTGNQITSEYVENGAQDMLKNKTDIISELSNIRHSLNKTVKSQIIKASLYVLVADGKINQSEESKLEDICHGLGISMSEYKNIKKQILGKKA